MSAQKPPFFHLLVATGFGSGFSPVAPGTAGALLAVLLWVAGYFLLPFAQLQVLLAVLVVYFTVQGVYSSGVMEKYWGEDPSRVVVDEMVGVWIPLLVVPTAGGGMWWPPLSCSAFSILSSRSACAAWSVSEAEWAL